MALLFLAAVTATGCGRHETSTDPKSAAPAPETTSTAPPTPVGRAPTSSSSPAIVVPDNVDVNATLGQISLELRKYVMRTRTVPKSFEEFLAKSQAQVPPPPAGKKYAIENQAVVLVKR